MSDTSQIFQPFLATQSALFRAAAAEQGSSDGQGLQLPQDGPTTARAASQCPSLPGSLLTRPAPLHSQVSANEGFKKNKIKIDLSVATWLAELPHPILKLLNIYIFNSMYKNKQAPGVTNSHAAVPDCPSRCSQHPVPPAPQPGCSRTQPGTVARTRAHPRPLPRAVQHQPLAATPGTDTSCCPSTKYRLVRAHPHPYRHRDEHLQGSPSLLISMKDVTKHFSTRSDCVLQVFQGIQWFSWGV